MKTLDISIIFKNKIHLPSQVISYLNSPIAILRKEFSNESIAIFSEKAWEQLMQKIIEGMNIYNREHNRLFRELVNFSEKCEVT